MQLIIVHKYVSCVGFFGIVNPLAGQKSRAI